MGKYVVMFMVAMLFSLFPSCEKKKEVVDNQDPPLPEVYIMVTSPAGGEQWMQGNVVTITWQSAGVDGKVRIELLKDQAVVEVIHDSTANTGNFSWTIPVAIPPAAAYMLRIISVKRPDIAGICKNAFEITKKPADQKSIIIKAPVGGEVWAPNAFYHIKWEKVGFTGGIKVELHNEQGFYNSLATVQQDNHYYWKVPESVAPSKKYKIKLISVEFSDVTVMSPAWFEIEQKPYIQVNKPKNTDAWGNKTYKSIEWESFKAGETVKIELYFRSSTFYEFKETTITSSTDNDGKYNWYVETDYIGNYCYRIKVISNKYSLVYDYSDYFSISF